LVRTSVATPDEFTLPVPIELAPFKNVTVPSGEPVGAGKIVAVSVTDCPNMLGLVAPVSTVVVTAWLITSFCAEDVEVANPALPEYTAVRLAVPTASVEVVTVATPEEFTTAALPICVAPLKKLTVPSGEPVGVGVMVAVNVTVAPKVAGFGEGTSAVVVACNTVRLCAVDVDVAKFVFPE
jgi:hypothetical protein